MLYLKTFFITYCTNLSFSPSILAVASSISTIELFFSKARHIQTSCFYPIEMLLLDNIESSPPFSSTILRMLHLLNISLISESEWEFAGSRFYLNEAQIRVGSCSIIVNEDLSYWMSYYLISLLFMINSPCAGSIRRRRQFIRDDFPAPVRPTIPTFLPAWIDKFMFFKIKGRPSRYLAEKLTNFIVSLEFFSKLEGFRVLIYLLPTLV